MYACSPAPPRAHPRPHCKSTHAWCLRLLRPGRPPPKGLVSAKSMCFWLSTRTRKDGTFTTCLPTLRARGAAAHGTAHGVGATLPHPEDEPTHPCARFPSWQVPSHPGCTAARPRRTPGLHARPPRHLGAQLDDLLLCAQCCAIPTPAAPPGCCCVSGGCASRQARSPTAGRPPTALYCPAPLPASHWPPLLLLFPRSADAPARTGCASA